MANIFERIAKRAAHPLEIDGETIYVREPTFGECERVNALTGQQRTGLTLAFCLVTRSGEREYPPQSGESDEALAVRVLSDMSAITPSTLNAIHAKLDTLTKPVDEEKLAKN